MAKYDVTHSCGHTQTHHISGPLRDREGRVERLSDQLCTECWQAAQQAERERKSAEAAAANSHLPELRGSDKQIAWAETIRREKLHDGRVEEYRERTPEEHKADLETYVSWVISQQSAAWWIEHRDMTVGDLLRVAARANQ